MIDPPRLAGAGLRHTFVRDMVVNASIGVYAHEREALQRVRINIDLGVVEQASGHRVSGLSRPAAGRDELSRVLDYEMVVRMVRDVVARGHVQLVETLAERIAEACLADRRVEVVKIRVEKLDVFEDVGSVGVEIERERPNLSTRGD